MTKKPSVKSSLPVPNQATPPSLPSRAPEPTVDRIEELAGRILRGDDALFHGNTKEFHHFFPRDYLKSKGIATRKANVLANFVMLTAASNKRITNRAPSDYLKEVKKELGANLDHLLETNLISPAAFEAAMKDDYDGFLTERSQSIASAVSGLTGW